MAPPPSHLCVLSRGCSCESSCKRCAPFPKEPVRRHLHLNTAASSLRRAKCSFQRLSLREFKGGLQSQNYAPSVSPSDAWNATYLAQSKQKKRICPWGKDSTDRGARWLCRYWGWLTAAQLSKSQLLKSQLLQSQQSQSHSAPDDTSSQVHAKAVCNRKRAAPLSRRTP